MRLSLSQLNKDEVLRYLGYRGTELPPQLNILIDECMQRTLQLVTPQYIYRRFSLSRSGAGIALGETGLVLSGRDIAAHLQGCEAAYLLCVTMGIAVDREIRSQMLTAPDVGVIMDACATTAVEAAADAAEELIRQECAIQGQDVTWRFSPGYGDLPLETQKKLLQVMDTPRKIGLTLSESLLMLPSKSVSAILGVLPAGQAQPKLCDCATCNKENCRFRKELF